ncbi:MAG: hydrogenase iron-sulfur subunit [Deltaproteobacteria bacterium]|nr:hydrogenase iron-sulfur subunit [Deltaproteobacteria bacterium]
MTQQEGGQAAAYKPRILTLSTVNISDIGIDMAGSSHMHYPPSVTTLMLPCSSGIKPQWILHAIEEGFDGVFIAADGTDCALVPDCTERTAVIVGRSQELLKERGYDAARVKMAAICSVCADSYVALIDDFFKSLSQLGPAKDKAA